MQPYKSIHHSGAVAYEIGEDYIVVKFRDGSKYLYDSRKPGSRHVSNMKQLAAKGDGLTTYINKYVRKNFSRVL